MLYTDDHNDDDDDDRNNFLRLSSVGCDFFREYYKLFVIMSKPESGVYLQYIIINTPYAYVYTRVYPPIICRTRRRRYCASRDQSGRLLCILYRKLYLKLYLK